MFGIMFIELGSMYSNGSNRLGIVTLFVTMETILWDHSVWSNVYRAGMHVQ